MLNIWQKLNTYRQGSRNTISHKPQAT